MLGCPGKLWMFGNSKDGVTHLKLKVKSQEFGDGNNFFELHAVAHLDH